MLADIQTDMFLRGEKQEIQKYIADLYGSKPLYSNYYGLDLEDVRYKKGTNTLLLKKQFGDFSRLYFVSSDKEELLSLLKEIGNGVAINIPAKGSIDDMEELLNNSGFSCIGVYERYFNILRKKSGVPVECFANVDDLNQIYDLLYNNFSPITDWLPNRDELVSMIKNKQIFVTKEDGKVKGVLTYTLQGVKFYLSAWIAKEVNDIKRSGMFLLLNFFSYVRSLNGNYVYGWVNSENHKVHDMHLVLGGKFDGLKDYTFTKTMQDKA